VSQSSRLLLSVLVVALCLSSPAVGIRSQTPDSDQPLVIQGGSIVDVVRGTLIPNSVVVIEGERITHIGTAGQMTVPANAHVIRADGKFVMPGLWDAHNHTRDFDAVLHINHGTTSVMDMGNLLDWIMVQAEGRMSGELFGPRIFPDGMVIAGRIGPHEWAPKTVEEARWAARKDIEAGATFLKVYQEATPEMVKAVAEEAHKAGLNLHGHLRVTDAREAALAGINALAHISGISAATVPPEYSAKVRKRESPFRELGYSGGLNSYLDDTSKYDDLIKLLVEKGIKIEPDIIAMYKGVYPQWEKFEAEDHMVVAKYQEGIRVSDDFWKNWATGFPYDRSNPETMARLKKGLENHNLFARKFVAAGGKTLTGTDAWGIMLPGLALWHEMELEVDAGLPILAVLQGATINPAEFVHQEKNLGTVEAGKLADVIVLGRNPLQNISNIRSLETVIQHGKIQKLGYKYPYEQYNPIPRPFYPTTSVLQRPFLTTVSPVAIPRGSADVILTIQGRDFNEQNRVLWNNVDLEVVKFGDTEMQVRIRANLLKQVGTYRIHMMTGGREPEDSYNYIGVLVSFGKRFETRYNGQTMKPEY
jgi:imidazolonepropionase-like amidohydrolase